jgi:hypothetical protein
MMESNEIMTAGNAALLEQVVVNGDLAKLTAPQRLDYYRQVCQSMGLNPLSKPFDYINLKGKLTLYAKKDATDQLRKINGVSIEDIKTEDEGDWFIVTVKGSDKTGRRDVEIGAVAKTDMSGNYGNALMKAVTKAKRRLTLSLCGLGWLDETEVETIPDARPVVVDSEGEIVDNTTKAAEAPKKTFDEEEYLRNYTHPSNIMTIAYEEAVQFKSDKTQVAYGDMTTKDLYCHWLGLARKLKDQTLSQQDRENIGMKISAIATIMWKRHSDLVSKSEE